MTPSLVLSGGAAFMLTHKIVDLHIGEVGIYSYTAAESDGPQSFKQVAVCPEISGDFYKLSDYTGTKFRGGNEQHTWENAAIGQLLAIVFSGKDRAERKHFRHLELHFSHTLFLVLFWTCFFSLSPSIRTKGKFSPSTTWLQKWPKWQKYTISLFHLFDGQQEPSKMGRVEKKRFGKVTFGQFFVYNERIIWKSYWFLL